tara:strand:- start:2599 stop:3273 length:675 start_codon:yes stop_codon:yes gene_type:complete
VSTFRQLALDIPLRPDSTFASWVGDAGAQLMQLATSPGTVVVRGAPCTGKTHLLQAACAAARADGRESMYVESLAGLTPAALDGLAAVTLLCVDGVSSVAGDAAWEEALFHLLNDVTARRHTVVLADPGRFVLKDLQSRLEAAAVVETDRLDDAGKIAVLIARAHTRGYVLPDEAARYLLSRHARDLASLLEVIEHIERLTLEKQRAVTIPLLRQALRVAEDES